MNDLNPTGGVFVDYTPELRAKAKLGKNLTTLADTAGKNPNDLITVYRGSAYQSEINNGDFITTNKQLALDYGGGKVISKKIRYGDILDNISEPLGEEYIYRKGAYEEITNPPTTKESSTVEPKPQETAVEAPTEAKLKAKVKKDTKGFASELKGAVKNGKISEDEAKNILYNLDEETKQQIVDEIGCHCHE